MLRVTVDTNVLDRKLERIRQAVDGLKVEILPTTVTLRERRLETRPGDPVVHETGVWGESRWGDFVWGASTPVAKSFIWDESSFDDAVLMTDDGPALFDAILAIVGSGSFPPPGQRENLTVGQRRQLRDAMILEAHAREGRDVLVTDDVRGFVGKDGEKRRKLEALCQTRIMTVYEFCAEAPSLGSPGYGG